MKQLQDETKAKLILLFGAIALIPSLWTLFQAIESAISNGTVEVALIGNYGMSNTKQVPWQQAWAAFAGPLLILCSMLIWRFDNKNSKKIRLGALLSGVGLVLTCTSMIFTSLHMTLTLVVVSIVVVLYARSITVVNSKFGKDAAIIAMVLVTAIFVYVYSKA